WFLERTRGGGKRMRRIYIVGLARKLVIALWRYLKDDTVPKGAVMKPMVTKPA
ncbi:MAG: transposase, partial [Burkholderiales bacterium]